VADIVDIVDIADMVVVDDDKIVEEEVEEDVENIAAVRDSLVLVFVLVLDCKTQ
jgi:hypothetical protein